MAAGVSPATHLRRRDREAAWPPAEARSSEERGAPVRCAALAQCYCARGETGPVTAPAGALCCPPDRPGALRGASGRCTSAVSWCIGVAGRQQARLRPKVSLCPERSVDRGRPTRGRALHFRDDRVEKPQASCRCHVKIAKPHGPLAVFRQRRRASPIFTAAAGRSASRSSRCGSSSA